MAKDLTPEEQAYFDTQGGEGEAATSDGQSQAQPEQQQEETQPTEQQAEGQGKLKTPKPKPPPGFVDSGALSEERQRRKDADRQLAEERKARQTLEERTNLLIQRFSQPQQEQAKQPIASDAPPDPNTDPIGHLAWQVNKVVENQNQLATHYQQQEQGRQQLTAVQQLQAQAAAAEQEYRRENPEYDSATTFLRQKRDQQLQMMGVTNPLERQQIIGQEAFQIAARAFQSGANPAEWLYNLATNNGFVSQATTHQVTETSGNGATQPNAQHGQAAVDTLKTIDRGQRENASLGAVRGAAPAKLTAQRLIEMPDAEFAKMISTPEGRALLG